MNDANAVLEYQLKDYWEHILQFNPTFATYIGDHRYNASLEDLSGEAIDAQAHYFRNVLQKIETLDTTLLSAENTLNFELFKTTLTNHLMMHAYKTHYIPLDHLRGPHIDFPQIIEIHPFRTADDLGAYAERLKAFPRQIDQVIELLHMGIRHKMTSYKKIIAHVLKQVEIFTKFAPEDNPLFAPVRKLNEGFSQSDIQSFDDTVRFALITDVAPAYKKLLEYLKNDYLRHCRESEGIWSLQQGDDMYRFLVNYHTTTPLSPEEIHEIGKGEVERIEGEIKQIMNTLGFHGSIRNFADTVKQKKELHPESGQEIIDSYRTILSGMDSRLPRFFGKLPKAKYDIKEIEHYREKSAPAAYYYPPPRDLSRPGYFYANTYKPEQRPAYNMEALAYHEAVPGHHLQIAIMQELEDLPDFRRHEGSTAFIEGWALYAEKLSREMGCYQDEYSEYGRLSFELWRAVRLVVDTGLHFYRWNREETIQYCKENTGLEEHEIEVEVDRYIAMPGQALAYKIGELKILELREKAERAFGSRFDIKEFHDRLLEKGAQPLQILENMMSSWMEGA